MRKIIKNKKGVSAMIGYVLLIAIAIVMSIVIYRYIRTYIPKDVPDCPDEVSVFVVSAECEGDSLKLILQNNGMFNIDGYFIRATTDSDQELATYNLAEDELEGFANLIVPLNPNQKTALRSFPYDDEIYTIEIIPTRIQKDENNKDRFVTCGKAKITENLPDSCHS